MTMMTITAFGAKNVPAATTKIILTLTKIRNRSKNTNNNQMHSQSSSTASSTREEETNHLSLFGFSHINYC